MYEHDEPPDGAAVKTTAGAVVEADLESHAEVTRENHKVPRTRSVADLVVTCLEKEGVRYVFGVPGEETEDLLFALADSSVRFVPCRHEQGAAFMADLWGRLTGEAGVCLATLGPGATNLLTGVADANLDKAPLVAITAQGGLDRLHHESRMTACLLATWAATRFGSRETSRPTVRTAASLATDSPAWGSPCLGLSLRLWPSRVGPSRPPWEMAVFL